MMATVESTTNMNKQIPKITEQAKAALEEQQDGPKKHKNGGKGGNVLKKGRTGPEIDCDMSTTRETLSSSPAPNQSRWATVEDVPNDDGFISQGSIDDDESRTTQGEKSNSKSRAVEPPRPLHAQPWSIDMSKSHAMHCMTRAANSHTMHQVSQPFPCAPAPRLTAHLISHSTSGAHSCACFACALSAIACYTSASNPTQLVNLLRTSSLFDHML